MRINDSVNRHFASVEDGYLQVCLCDKTCNHHAALEELCAKGYLMLLHTKDENGNIAPLKTFEDLVSENKNQEMHIKALNNINDSLLESVKEKQGLKNKLQQIGELASTYVTSSNISTNTAIILNELIEIANDTNS